MKLNFLLRLQINELIWLPYKTIILDFSTKLPQSIPYFSTILHKNILDFSTILPQNILFINRRFG